MLLLILIDVLLFSELHSSKQTSSGDSLSVIIMTFDDVLQAYVGKFGRLQLLCLLILAVPGIQLALNTMEIVFILQVPSHSCKVTGLKSNSTGNFTSMSISEKLRVISPLIEGNDGQLERDTCRVYSANFTEEMFWVEENQKINISKEGRYDNVSLKTCKSWEYDNSGTGHTMVSEWNLVCDRYWLQGIIKTTQLVGQIIGVLMGSIISDRFGRQIVGRVSVIITVIMRITMAFTPILEIYMVARMINGACDILLYTSFYVLCTEILRTSKRSFVSAAAGTGYVIGGMIVPLLAWLIPNWRHLTIANTVFTTILCLALFYLPESPRWLYCVGKQSKAKKTLEWMAKVNRHDIPIEVAFLLDNDKKDSEGDGCCSFLKSLIIFVRLVSNCFIWFAVVMIFYAISLNVGSLAGNIYINAFLMGIIDIPGCCFIMFFVNSPLGRRFTIFLSLLVCTVTLFADIAFPRTSIARTALSVTGKMSVNIAFIAIYIWTPEMFPTGMRATAIGTSSAIGRVGCSISPLISLIPGIIPAIIFGIVAAAATLSSLALPETKGKPYPITVDDMYREHSLLCPCIEQKSGLKKENVPVAAPNESRSETNVV